MLPDNRNATAGNGGGSENIKADGLSLSSLSPGTDFTAEDRHAAFVAGYETGKAERVEVEVEDRARALLHTWATESQTMATKYAARVGPAWSALILECSQIND